MATEAQIKAIRKYEKENMKRVTFMFNLKNDADILNRLESVPSKAGYIKALIRADIARQQNESSN